MQRQRGELVPIGEAIGNLDAVLVPSDPRRHAPVARHHFTRASIK